LVTALQGLVPLEVSHTIAPLRVDVNLVQAGFLAGLEGNIKDAVEAAVRNAIPNGNIEDKGLLE